jgi:class 3 adenylate cyclase
MAEINALLDILANAVPATVAQFIGRLVREGGDADLLRINVPALARLGRVDEETLVNGFLHAASLGIFDISWNVLCPGCGGVLDTNASLKTLVRSEYACALCSGGFEPVLDDLVEVTFTVSPRVRRIAGHSPHTMPFLDYMRGIYWGSCFDVTEAQFAQAMDDVVIDTLELQPGEKGVLSVQLPAEFIIVFEPVTHSVQFIDVKGEPDRERRALTLIYDRDHTHTRTMDMRPGPLRLSVENRTEVRVLPVVFRANDTLHDLLDRRRPHLTAKRLLTNQTFRDLYRTNTLDIDQRLKITSMTFLFTDLRGSTALYDRVGDLVAFDLVRAHFKVLNDIVAAESGAVVKTIGDAVMATFASPERGLAAAVRMREAMRAMNRDTGHEDLELKIGLHEGPCIAVTQNERQDYFGQTVNIAARVQGLADARAIYATGPVVEAARAAHLLDDLHLTPTASNVGLRGISRDIPVFAIA